jgi:hypothetical protein
MVCTFKASRLVYVALFTPIAYAQCSFVHGNGVAAPVVLVLQAHIQMRIEKDKGFTESEGTTDAVRAGFQGVLARTFEDEGHKLLLDPMVEGEWEEAAPNAGTVSALNDQFNSMIPPAKPGFSPNCRALANLSFKTEIEKFKNHDDFDLVIVSRATGTKVEETKGGKATDALGAALGVPGAISSDSLSFDIGVVDRATGSLLFYCSSNAAGDYVDRPDARLSGPIRKCLAQYFHGKQRRQLDIF